MVTSKRTRVLIALSVAGSFGWTPMGKRALADDPRDTAAPPAATTAAPMERYLLLTNGQLIKGTISEREADYQVGQRVGAMSFPKRQVEGAFDSVEDAYRYRVEQLPERDTEERMKLALWCLNLKMKNEARAELTKVIELNPRHTQAKAMLFSMQQAAEIAAQRRRDPDVRQTAAEASRESRPATLDSAVIQNAQRGLGISGLPVIFDLPAPLAVRRANEYFRSVHPLLQAYCARCHDGNYDGEFQLIPIKSRADRNPDSLRANLDATLRLINPESPAKSELLASSLRPHGGGPRPRPIFTGSNDKSYQILATWVQSLRPTKAGGEPGRGGLMPAAGDTAELFATDRGAITSDSRQQSGAESRAGGGRASLAADAPETNHIPPPLRYRGNLDLSDRKDQAPDPRELEFPLPPVIGGFKTPSVAAIAEPKKEGRKNLSTTGAAGPLATGPVDSSAKGPLANDRPGAADQGKGSTGAGTPKKKSKPVQIDPKILERALQNRNSGR